MFKRIFAILFALLMLCACNVEEPEIPVVPEEPEISGETEIPEEELEKEENPEFVEPVEPELIAEHIEALNEAARELFGAEYIQGINFSFYFKEENTEWNTVPDAVNFSDGGKLYYDFFERTCFEVTNFSTKAEVREYMSRWLDPSLFENEASGIDFNFMEFDGKLYLMRGNRGYGIKSYGNSEIIKKTEKTMTAVAFIYHRKTDEVGTAEIKFEKIDGRWIIVSVEDNYY